MNLKEFINNKTKLNELMKASLAKSPGSGLLKEFSPWLAAYHKEDYPKHIEVPGTIRRIVETETRVKHLYF